MIAFFKKTCSYNKVIYKVLNGQQNLRIKLIPYHKIPNLVTCNLIRRNISNTKWKACSSIYKYRCCNKNGMMLIQVIFITIDDSLENILLIFASYIFYKNTVYKMNTDHNDLFYSSLLFAHTYVLFA